MTADNRSPTPPLRIVTGLPNYPPGADFFTHGGSGIIYTLPDRPDVVVKVPIALEEAEEKHKIERRIFERLGTHPNIVKVVDMDDHGIYLEHAHPGCLRLFYQNGGEAKMEERLAWCRDVAFAQQYLHDNNVRHADLSGRNLLLDKGKILLCDFAGSYIDGEEARIRGQGGFIHPDDDESSLPTLRSELHCLGSTMFEIITGLEPHAPQDESAAKKLMRDGFYPDTNGLVLGDIISKCWKGDFISAADVAAAIDSHL